MSVSQKGVIAEAVAVLALLAAYLIFPGTITKSAWAEHRLTEGTDVQHHPESIQSARMRK